MEDGKKEVQMYSGRYSVGRKGVEMSKIMQLIKEFKQQLPQCRGGVFVIYNNEVEGWMCDLRDPYKYIPGCIAVDENGNQWVAQGGNDYDGAQKWVRQIAENKRS